MQCLKYKSPFSFKVQLGLGSIVSNFNIIRYRQRQVVVGGFMQTFYTDSYYNMPWYDCECVVGLSCTMLKLIGAKDVQFRNGVFRIPRKTRNCFTSRKTKQSGAFNPS